MYRYHLFWQFHTAHAVIYGVIHPFWAFVLRPPGQAATAGAAAADIIIPNEVKKELSRRVTTDVFKRTGCISGKVPEVTKCEYLCISIYHQTLQNCAAPLLHRTVTSMQGNERHDHE
jgi:hypothetical protein